MVALMDIDEYLRQKKTLEEKQKLLETQSKVYEQKQKIDKEPISPSFPPSQPAQPTLPSREPSSNMSSGSSSGGGKTLMIINLVVLLGVLAVFAIFYLFPPTMQNELAAENKLTGQVVAENTQGNEKTTDGNKKETTTSNGSTATEKEEEETVYVGPQFDMSIQDTTEGLFDENGKLKNTGKILSIQGPTFYNEFSILFNNEEKDKILCSVDRKIDIDSDLDGIFDVKGIYSLDRHTIEIEALSNEEIKAGIESVPGSISGYQGKGEVWAEYETRCYFCLDDNCEDYEKKGEEVRKAFFRVRINDNLLYGTSTSNGTNSS